MDLDHALHAAHMARRRADISSCRIEDCTHCACILLADEVRRLRLTIAQTAKVAALGVAKFVPPALCICGARLVDGMCSTCDG